MPIKYVFQHNFKCPKAYITPGFTLIHPPIHLSTQYIVMNKQYILTSINGHQFEAHLSFQKHSNLGTYLKHFCYFQKTLTFKLFFFFFTITIYTIFAVLNNFGI
jgi:hypothetical protein